MDTEREYDTNRIYIILDRIAHHSTNGHDLVNSTAGLRRLLYGANPSDVLRMQPPKKKKPDGSKATIANLRAKLAQVESAKAECERDAACLAEQVAKLQSQLGQSPAEPQSQDFLTYDEVLQAMLTKFGKHHGVPAALFERNTQLVKHGETTDKITSSAFQQWRKENHFPLYVIEQIEAMTPDDLLPRGKWNDDERQYLAELYSVDSAQTNKALAIACSEKFDRLVTECAIKGELNRLRASGKVPRYR